MDSDLPARKNDREVDALDVGGPPVHSQATLCIYGDQLDPDAVTALVQCTPTKARRKGECFPDRPNLRPASTGQWFLEAPDDLPFSDKIRYLVDSTCDDENVWQRLVATLSLELRAAVYLASWTEGFELCNRTLADIARRKWCFCLTMYSAEGDEIIDAFLSRDRKTTE